MSAYGPLAQRYDELTGDVPYGRFAETYEKLLHREGKEHLTLLDLCCGTGTLTCLFAQKGHEMIGVDASPEMLSVAQEKADGLACPVKPLFLCQDAAELDLYGTVEGAYCSLDGMNYLPPEDLPELFRRLHLFLEPGGKFAFDMHTPEHLRALDGGTFVDEGEDLLCLWRGDFDPEENALFYAMDIFRREGRLWRRDQEEHIEYAHEPERVAEMLSQAGFTGIQIIRDGVQSEMGRLFVCAENLGH
ncbi:MAG: class I SAM-dependent DNA methyltransferase [Oscillospiraceae bacterium]